MFFWSKAITVGLLSLFGASLTKVLFYPSQEQKIEFQTLLNSIEGSKETPKVVEINQERFGIRKDFIYPDEGGYSRAIVNAKESILALIQHGEDKDVEEKLKEVTFSLPFGKDKYEFLAETALFNYSNQELVAQNVSLSAEKEGVQGKALALHANLKGASPKVMAEKATLTLENGSEVVADEMAWEAKSIDLNGNVELTSPQLVLKADHAEVFLEDKRLILSGNPHGVLTFEGNKVTFKAQEITWDDIAKKISLKNNVEVDEGTTKVFSKFATCIVKREGAQKTEAQEIQFHEDVQIIRGNDGKNKALADHLYFNLLEKTMVLTADPGKKVLLYDDTNHMQMSAEKLIVKKQGANAKESIETEGNVQLRLKAEELERFKDRVR